MPLSNVPHYRGPFMETRLKEGYKGLMVGGDGFALASGLGSALGAAREAVKNHKIPN